MGEMFDETLYDPGQDAGAEPDYGEGWDASQQGYGDGADQFQDGAGLDGDEYIRSVMREELAPYLEQQQQLVEQRQLEQGEQEVLGMLEEAGVPEEDFGKVLDRAAEILHMEVSRAVEEAGRQGVSLEQLDPAQLQAALEGEVVRAFEKATGEFVPRPQGARARSYSLAGRYAKEGGPRPEVVRQMAEAGYRIDDRGNVVAPGRESRMVR